ncbi:hypothetical protein C8Q80DRAFT_1267474 [Daedaleopsis nitida]|nr:hypothetical protein C8Q80DRAFT_1267474 [Daedaleopsis nitida]
MMLHDAWEFASLAIFNLGHDPFSFTGIDQKTISEGGFWLKLDQHAKVFWGLYKLPCRKVTFIWGSKMWLISTDGAKPVWCASPTATGTQPAPAIPEANPATFEDPIIEVSDYWRMTLRKQHKLQAWQVEASAIDRLSRYAITTSGAKTYTYSCMTRVGIMSPEVTITMDDGGSRRASKAQVST